MPPCTATSLQCASLLEKKADVNAPQVDGTTALHWAVRANDLEMTDLLLKAGATRFCRESVRRNADAAGCIEWQRGHPRSVSCRRALIPMRRYPKPATQRS